MDVKQLDATVRGRVQGVSFRYYTQLAANRLNLVGWVANQRDGTVRTVAQGDEASLKQFVDFLWQGSPAARVEQVDVTWETAVEPFDRFQVRWLP